MELAQMREKFISAVMHIAARDGLEKTTTKKISQETGLNEAYIYRCFDCKEDLLREAYLQHDQRRAEYSISIVPMFRMPNLPLQERCFLCWHACWNYLLSDPDACMFSSRYAHSAYFRPLNDKALSSHISRLADMQRHLFLPDIDLESLLQQVRSTMLFFAVRIIQKEMSGSPETVRWIFQQIYSFVRPNLAPEVLEQESQETNSV